MYREWTRKCNSLCSQSTPETARGKRCGKEKPCQSHEQVDMSLGWELSLVKTNREKG